MIRFVSGGATDVGAVRSENQDSFVIANATIVVADGMGGHQGGEVASALAVQTFTGKITSENASVEELINAAKSANRAVFEKAQTDPSLRGMGTTLTTLGTLEVDGENRVGIAHIGDSRAYLMRDGDLQQLTRDHSLVEEMVRTGQLSEKEAEGHPKRNILTRALGVEPDVEVDVVQVLPLRGDRFLLCSDGLVRELTDDQIASVLRRLSDPTEAARDLVKRAKEAGGADNITVVIVDVADTDVDPEAAARSAQSAPLTTVAPIVNTPSTDSSVPPNKPAPTQAHSTPLVTVRVVLFLVVLVGVIGGALWLAYSYATRSYFVTTTDNHITIYKGRPGGALGFQPKVTKTYTYTLDDVAPARQDQVKMGKTFTTRAEAEAYVQRLVDEKVRLGITPTTVATLQPVTTTTT